MTYAPVAFVACALLLSFGLGHGMSITRLWLRLGLAAASTLTLLPVGLLLKAGVSSDEGSVTGCCLTALVLLVVALVLWFALIFAYDLSVRSAEAAALEGAHPGFNPTTS